MRLLMLSLLIAISFSNLAQSPNSEMSEKFKNVPITYVQSTGDKKIDTLMAQALATYWTLNKYQLVSDEKISKELSNPKSALLIFLTYASPEGPHTPKKMIFKFSRLALVMGGPDGKYTLIHLETIDYKGISTEDRPYAYTRKPMLTGLEFRLVDIVKQINDEVTKKWTTETTRKKLDILKVKTLCVLHSNVEDEEKIKKTYPYKIEFMDLNQLNAIVKGRRKDAVYLVLTSTYNLDELIITDPETHEKIYSKTFNYVTQIDAGDFKDLAKYIETGKYKR